MMDAAVARGRVTVAALVRSRLPRARTVASGGGKLKVLWKTTSRPLASAQQDRDGGKPREIQTVVVGKQPLHLLCVNHSSFGRNLMLYVV